MKLFKSYKDARLKSFKNQSDALEFARSGLNPNINISKSASKSTSSDP